MIKDATRRPGMFRQPHVSDTHIAFVFAGDLWIVDRDGGEATQITEMTEIVRFPRFSPCGRYLAFSAGDTWWMNLYVIEIQDCSQPIQLTAYPREERMLEWEPDGRSILFASSRTSAFPYRYQQLYRVEIDERPLRSSKPPRKVDLPFCEFAASSPDRRFIAFQTKTTHRNPWRGYRGGLAPNLFLLDTRAKSGASIRELTSGNSTETNPQWIDSDRLVFVSDRGSRNSRFDLWLLNTSRNEEPTRLTQSPDFDIRNPAVRISNAGSTDIVFEKGGSLVLCTLSKGARELGRCTEVEIEIPPGSTDLSPFQMSADQLIDKVDLHPKKSLAVVSARGGIFSVDYATGEVQNNKGNSSRSNSRWPSFSPLTGRWLAYHSDSPTTSKDATAEYQLVIDDLDSATPRRIELGPRFRYSIEWSPDELSLAFIDHELCIWLVDRASGRQRQLVQVEGFTSRTVARFTLSWSPDSRWLAFSRPLHNRNNAIFLIDTKGAFDKQNKSPPIFQVTSGDYNDFQPRFDVRSQIGLFFLSRRRISSSVIGEVGYGSVYVNTTRIAFVPIPTELLVEGSPRASKAIPVYEQIEPAIEELPIAAGAFRKIVPTSEGLIYHRDPSKGSGSFEWPIYIFDRTREDAPGVLLKKDAVDFVVAGEPPSMLVEESTGRTVIENLRCNRGVPMSTSQVELDVEPRLERIQIFEESFRLIRDFFYFGNNSATWPRQVQTIYQRHRPRLDSVVNRRELDELLRDVGADLPRGHFKVTAGPGDEIPRPTARFLGADIEFSEGRFVIARILRGASSDSRHRSPLDYPLDGDPAKEGMSIEAIDGQPIDSTKDFWFHLGEQSPTEVVLTLSQSPCDGASRRRIKVRTLSPSSESSLRLRAWAETNRRWVDRVSDGEVGYVAIPDTGGPGQALLLRQYQAQYDRWGLIFDARFNRGGSLYPDSMIELLDRPRTATYEMSLARSGARSFLSRTGPQVMLINGWTASGGDLLAYLFRKVGLGKLVGTRTWGGVITGAGVPRFIDGGFLSVPNLMFRSGPVGIEGKGVRPSRGLEVEEDLVQLSMGRDSQLEAALAEVLSARKSRDNRSSSHDDVAT